MNNFRFKKSNFKRKAPKLSEFIPWLRIEENGLVYNKDDSMQLTFSFRGPDLDSSTLDDLVNYNDHINNAIKGARTGFVFYVENQRRRSASYDEATFPSPLTRAIEEERKEYFNDGEHYENYYYFTILYHPTFAFSNQFLKFFRSHNVEEESATYWKQIQEATEQFLEEVGSLIDLFSAIFMDVKPLTADETLTYLHSTISDHYQEVANIPSMYLSSYLLDSPFVGGIRPKLGKKHVRIISLLSFPRFSSPGHFDLLNHLNFEYRWVTRFHALSKMDADSMLSSIAANYKQQAKSIFQYVVESIRNIETDQVNESMLTYAEEAKIAKHQLENDYVGEGYYTMTLVIMDEDEEAVAKKVDIALAAIRGLQFTAVEETMNAEKAFFGTIPGMWTYNVRKYLLSTLNFSHLAPTSAIWSGEKKNKHLKGPVLLHTETQGATPFRLSLHVGDVGHTLIAGPTGSGKSVLLNMIETHFLKYKDARLFVFDVGSSSRAISKAMGGNFYDIMGEQPKLAFQPFARIDEPNELAWSHDWIYNYLVAEKLDIGNAELKAMIMGALQSLQIMEPSLRTISSFIRIVQDQRIRKALMPLSEEGVYGKLFDNNVDKFGEGRWQVFEMDELMKQPLIVPTVLDFLFHRIDSQLKEDGSPVLIVMDECWVFFANPVFQARIRKYFKDLRKKNASIIVATQNLSDITVNAELSNTILENCHTQIYLPNPKATREGIRQHYINFGLNERELEILSNLRPKLEYYVTTSTNGKRSFQLAVQPLEGAFVLATNKEDQLKIDELEREGIDGEEFISYWLRYKGVPDASYSRYKEALAKEREESV